MHRERKLAVLWSLVALARSAVASASKLGRNGSRALIAVLVVAAACSSVEKQDKQNATEQHLGKTSSALTLTRYEGEAMAWSGVEGADGQIRTVPSPTHRYFWTNGYVS
jgi:hypothetical protein